MHWQTGCDCPCCVGKSLFFCKGVTWCCQSPNTDFQYCSSFSQCSGANHHQLDGKLWWSWRYISQLMMIVIHASRHSKLFLPKPVSYRSSGRLRMMRIMNFFSLANSSSRILSQLLRLFFSENESYMMLKGALEEVRLEVDHYRQQKLERIAELIAACQRTFSYLLTDCSIILVEALQVTDNWCDCTLLQL